MATTSTLSPLLHSSRKELGRCWEAFVFGANPTIEFEDFIVVQELLRRNVNANTLEKSDHGVLLSPQPSVFGRGGTLLDVVERKLKNLREDDVMKVDEAFPWGLQHDGYYIGDIEEGTYQHWSAKDLELARSIVRIMQVELEQKLLVRKQPGLEEKREALRGLIRDFEEAETMLIERGAKTLQQLHRDIKTQDKFDQYAGYEAKPFNVRLDFQIPDRTDIKGEGFVQL
ncbi:MAG: hypothetical protein M1830_010817 [Pleopsidium flavum]|nr:MAG: hypothetical protein M1830_010817 [Pleopsidium flavum]